MVTVGGEVTWFGWFIELLSKVTFLGGFCEAQSSEGGGGGEVDSVVAFMKTESTT